MWVDPGHPGSIIQEELGRAGIIPERVPNSAIHIVFLDCQTNDSQWSRVLAIHGKRCAGIKPVRNLADLSTNLYISPASVQVSKRQALPGGTSILPLEIEHGNRERQDQ
jgi:hypothetical protein